MHASQVSSAGASAYPPVYTQRKTRGTDDAAPAQAVERRSEHHHHQRSERSERSEDSRPIRNPSNPLVNAMMEALKGLTRGAGKADDSAGAATPAKEVSTAAATSGDVPKSVKEAALNFANELYSALRAAGESSGAAAPKKTGYGDAGSDYGDLAQGLKRLAQSVAAPANGHAAAVAAAPAAVVPTTSSAPVSAAAPKPVSAPVSAPAVALAPPAAPAAAQPAAAAAPKPVAANPETPKPSAPVPVPATAASASRSPITINITFNFVNSTAIGAPKTAPAPEAGIDPSSDDVDATRDSPLLKAFKELMAALNGDAAEGGATIDNDKAIQMLQSFLQKIAESLDGGASAQAPETTLPAKGSLISVTA